MNDFQACLKASHDAEDLPFWEEVYNKAFPTAVAIINHRQDGWHQRAGIDRSIILDDSRQIFVDEKVRGRNKVTGRVYDDIALEYISVDTTNAPGWVCKKIRSDYIAYAIAPLGVCYLLPVQQLQTAWARKGEQWKAAYKTRAAINNGYKTWFCPVPPRELFKEMLRDYRISFSPFELEE
jgi:hypothetical protein